MTAVEWLQSQIVFESVDKELLARWDEDSDLSEYFEQAKAMEKNNTDNKVIHFAEWLTNKHTTTLITLYEQFEEQYYNQTFKS